MIELVNLDSSSSWCSWRLGQEKDRSVLALALVVASSSH